MSRALLDTIAAAQEPWMSSGLCLQTDPELFFPPKGAPTKDARRVCANCPVKNACLDYALESGERYGIWGGLGERERRALRRTYRPVTAA